MAAHRKTLDKMRATHGKDAPSCDVKHCHRQFRRGRRRKVERALSQGDTSLPLMRISSIKWSLTFWKISTHTSSEAGRRPFSKALLALCQEIQEDTDFSIHSLDSHAARGLLQAGSHSRIKRREKCIPLGGNYVRKDS